MEQFLPGAAVDRSTGASGRVIKSVDLSSLTTISDLRITNRGWYDFVLLLLHLPFFFLVFVLVFLVVLEGSTKVGKLTVQL